MGRKTVNPRRRSHWLLVVACCLAVTAIAISYWQYADATSPASPAPRELKLAAAPAPRHDVAPPARSKRVSAPTTKATATHAPTPETPPRVVRRDRPAETTVERRENALPPSASKTNKSPAEVYEAMARVSLQKRDYAQAREQMETALANGGKATFMLIHDHNRGNFDAGDTKATCLGELRILADGVRFEAINDVDGFSANWADVREAGSNKFFGSGLGGFHVTITAGGKHKNFNLAPESKEKAEAKLILDLLDSYTRRSDRTR
jgi:hypothetical protein